MWKEGHPYTYGQHGKEFKLMLEFKPYYGHNPSGLSKVVTAIWDSLNECFWEKETMLEIYREDIEKWWEK